MTSSPQKVPLLKWFSPFKKRFLTKKIRRQASDLFYSFFLLWVIGQKVLHLQCCVSGVPFTASRFSLSLTSYLQRSVIQHSVCGFLSVTSRSRRQVRGVLPGIPALRGYMAGVVFPLRIFTRALPIPSSSYPITSVSVPPSFLMAFDAACISSALSPDL